MSEKRLAIVTGGSRGIGRQIVLTLARQNRKVVAFATNKQNLDNLKQQTDKEGLDVLIEVIDITDSENLNQTILNLAKQHSGIGILVNNAGITRDGLLITTSNQDFDKVIETNLKAAFIATRAAVRSMIRNRFGRIVNIASVSGIIGNAGQANYAASKAGLIGMTKSIARELAKKNITVNCVAPGFIVTDMTQGLPDQIKESVNNLIPMKKFGNVEDVAHAVAFLTDDHTQYITGQVLGVDGGMAM